MGKNRLPKEPEDWEGGSATVTKLINKILPAVNTLRGVHHMVGDMILENAEPGDDYGGAGVTIFVTEAANSIAAMVCTVRQAASGNKDPDEEEMKAEVHQLFLQLRKEMVHAIQRTLLDKYPDMKTKAISLKKKEKPE